MGVGRQWVGGWMWEENGGRCGQLEVGVVAAGNGRTVVPE